MQTGLAAKMVRFVVLLVVVCTLALQSSVGAQVKDTIAISRVTTTLGMDPGFLREPGTIVDNIFDTLVMRDENMKLVPGLATSWKAVNPTTWQFTLRQGIKFHNGEPFDAEAVKYTIERVLDPAKRSPTISYIRTIDRVEVVGPYAVNIITSAPDPLTPTRLSRYPAYVVPPKYVREVGDAEFAARPVGTGAYRFVRWVKDDHILLEANTQYWRGRPRIEKIIWRTIPDDVARVAALQRGEADIIEPLAVDWVETVERSPRLRAERVKHGGLIIYLGLRFDVPPLNDRRVRQAMAYAIDVDTIVSKILRGFATPIGTQVGPFDFGYSPNVPRYPYNPAKAKALLTEAGFPNGFDTAFQGTRRYLKGGDVSQALAEQLAAVGVRAKLEIPEWQVYVQLVPVKKQAAIYMLGWGSTQTLDADAAIYAIMRSGEPYSTVSIAKLDQLLDDARRTIDPAARAQVYRQIQTLAHDEVPMLTLYQEDAVYGINNRVVWKGRADARIPVFDMRFQQ